MGCARLRPGGVQLYSKAKTLVAASPLPHRARCCFWDPSGWWREHSDLAAMLALGLAPVAGQLHR